MKNTKANSWNNLVVIPPSTVPYLAEWLLLEVIDIGWPNQSAYLAALTRSIYFKNTIIFIIFNYPPILNYFYYLPPLLLKNLHRNNKNNLKKIRNGIPWKIINYYDLKANRAWCRRTARKSCLISKMNFTRSSPSHTADTSPSSRIYIIPHTVFYKSSQFYWII